MKIRPEHFEKLRDAMLPVLSLNSDAYKEYKAKGLSKHRFVWDVLWAAKPGTTLNDIYGYANDAHITTALMKICSPFMI